LFINFMENSNKNSEVRASNTKNTKRSFRDTNLNIPNNSQNENSDERVSNISATQNIEANSSKSNNNPRPKKQINQSSKILTELDNDQSEDNRPKRRKTRSNKHSQKVNTNSQKETSTSSSELINSQQNVTDTQNNPDQMEGSWHFFKKGFYKNDKGLKDFFDGGFVFFPKGFNTKNLFAGTHINQESPSVFVFLNPDESDGNWYYFKEGKYLDNTTRRQKNFKGGYVFLPSNCENGVWSAIQYSLIAPPYPVTDPSNTNIDEISGASGYQVSRLPKYIGQEKINYEIMKAHRVFESKTIFETMPKSNNSIVEILKGILGDRLSEWKRLNVNACGIYSRDNDDYNNRMSKYANEVVRHVKSLQTLEKIYNKGEIDKINYEEKKSGILTYIFYEEKKFRYLKSVR
ncbi:hypothetical protein TWF706_004724, partial (mitochondrion) [Orbilia oligospora]